HAPMLAAGVGSFLTPTQKSRTFDLEMEPYSEETRPEREYDDDNVDDLNAVDSYLRHWAAKVKLDLRPPMPPGVLRRFADNVRGLLWIGDSCGSEWGQRARAAITFLLEKEKAERPQITMLRHGLAIFDALELDAIRSTRFNQELKRHDAPDARWTRYRGSSGTDYAHPIEMYEQAQLLAKVGIRSVRIRPSGEKQCYGYKLVQFQDAWRKHGTAAPGEAEPARGRLRLITSEPD